MSALCKTLLAAVAMLAGLATGAPPTPALPGGQAGRDQKKPPEDSLFRGICRTNMQA